LYHPSAAVAPEPAPRKDGLRVHGHPLRGQYPPHDHLAATGRPPRPRREARASDAAQEILQTNDLTFASRPALIAPEIICYGGLDLAFWPYGNFWRALRKLCMLKLLSTSKVRQLAPIRDNEIMSLVTEIRATAAAAGGKADVNIGKMLVS
jgi:hypothetical protein